MKKLIVFSFLALIVGTAVGCGSSGLPRSCFMRSWFCGKECQPEPTYSSCYPDECSPSLGAPIISDGSCATCTVPGGASTTTYAAPSPSANPAPLDYVP